MCEYVDFGEVDQFSPEAVEKYEDALNKANEKGIRIKALIVCHPHNPLGRCYPPETLIELMKLCNKHKVHLLADEIYALSVFDIEDPKAVKFQSVLSLGTSQYISSDYFHLLYGMSKDMASGGLRLGCLHTANEDLMRAMSTISQFHWSGGVNERVATLMLEDEKWMDSFLELSRSRLAERNKIGREMLDDECIKYYQGANAGFFLWIDLRPWLHRSSNGPANDPFAAEDALTEKLIENKVFITNGREMSAEEPGWYRLIFSQDERTVKEGIRRYAMTTLSTRLTPSKAADALQDRPSDQTQSMMGKGRMPALFRTCRDGRNYTPTSTIIPAVAWYKLVVSWRVSRLLFIFVWGSDCF